MAALQVGAARKNRLPGMCSFCEIFVEMFVLFRENGTVTMKLEQMFFVGFVSI